MTFVMLAGIFMLLYTSFYSTRGERELHPWVEGPIYERELFLSYHSYCMVHNICLLYVIMVSVICHSV
jgi:hypothetical protein